LSIADQYSNMSSGQYNMQFEIELENQSRIVDDEVTPTIYLVCVNSGIFITENGSSSFRTGLLNQEMVLETKTKDAVMDTHSYENKIVGGSIENINSVHKHMKLNFHKASEQEHLLDNEQGEAIPRLSNPANSMHASGMAASGMSKRRIHKFAN
jgi:hypothetical protein